MTTTNDTGVAETETRGLDTVDDAANAFLAHLEDAGKPSEEGDEPKKKKTEEKPETKEDKTPKDDAAEEQDAESEDEASEETEEDKPKEKSYVEDDEALIKVKVGDEEHEFAVKDLKRLAGQEKALTQKSQEVAAQRTKLDQEATRNLAGLNVLVERAKAKADPYKKIDFLVASKQLNAEELTALREQAQSAFDEEKFLTTELDGFMKQVSDVQQANLVTTARETVKALSNTESPYHIEGWNEQEYNNLRTFAVAQGLPQEIVNNLVEAPALKLLHMAMMFSKGAAKVATVKVNKSVKKIVKSSSSPVPSSHNSKTTKVKKADAALKAKGNLENAANAFLARFESDED